jgi:Cof subfamily protein (haloacid dehalogenase superfamily)
LKYRLVAVDLDGTLLNDKKEIDHETIRALHNYRHKGGSVVITSGRSPLSTRWIAETIGLKDEPIIAYNGAIILDEKGQWLSQEIFQINTLLNLWEICETEGLYAHFYEGDTLLIPEINQWNEHWIENNIPHLKQSGGLAKNCGTYRAKCGIKTVNDFYSYFKTEQPRIAKIAIFDKQNSLVDFAKQLGERIEGLEISSSFHFLNLEISPSGVTKASALAKICEWLNIPLSQIAAIGDNFNDAMMLSEAGLGIAMGNAPDEVKQLADQVTGSNSEAGVAQAIRNYLLS